MCCIKDRLKSNIFRIFIDFSLVFLSIQAKVIDKDDCPLIDCEGSAQASHKPQRYQRLFLFSNAVLQVTPKIQIPQSLTGSVDTGFTLALPIKVKFQSQVELMSDWIKRFLATKTNRLTKNFNSFSAQLTQLLGLLNPSTNVGPNSSEQHNSGSGPGAGSAPTPDLSAADIGSDSNSSATHSSESNGVPHSSERKDRPRLVLQSKLADDSRAQARNILFKSIEISHSTLGKSCLLRAICEVSQTPIMAPNTGLFGEILDMFLTINEFHESLTDFEDYINAQTVGRNSFTKQSGNRFANQTYVDECRLYYGNDCPFSLFNINNILPLNL